jgi:hypothetical protein
MNTKRNSNRVLMNHWAKAWTTLGRWQELNARLSREMTPPTGGSSGWMPRSSASFSTPVAMASASATA